MEHNKVFNTFGCWSGKCSSKYEVNFLGVLTNKEYICNLEPLNPVENTPKQEHEEIFVNSQYPDFNETYFELINVLETVVQAKDNYTIMELGAGFGPHLANAVGAIRSYHGEEFPFLLIGAEGEPTCFQWLKQHLRYNRVDPDKHQLYEAVVTKKDGEVRFEVGFPRGYGSFMVSPARYVTNPARRLYRFIKRVRKRIKGQECLATDYWLGKKGLGIYTKKVRAVSLNTLLQDLNLVDLIHLDINGAEYDVLNSASEAVNKKAKRIHIGTHNTRVEAKLRGLFSDLGWKCMYDYPGRGRRQTEYGMIEFADGVQTWINPRLA